MKFHNEAAYVDAVAEARKQAGLSQANVAHWMTGHGHDWHQTTAAKVEAKDRGLRLGEAMSLSALLGVPLPESPQAERRAQIAGEIEQLVQQVKKLASEL